jgi:hypothetical protein
MVLIVLEIIALECHQTDDGSLLGFGSNLVGIERLGRELGCLFGGSAFAFCGGVVAGSGFGSDGDYLGF